MSNKSWHKSSYSSSGGNCVEVREHETGTDIRDTQHREAGHLGFDHAEWAALVRSASQP